MKKDLKLEIIRVNALIPHYNAIKPCYGSNAVTRIRRALMRAHQSLNAHSPTKVLLSLLELRSII